MSLAERFVHFLIRADQFLANPRGYMFGSRAASQKDQAGVGAAA